MGQRNPALPPEPLWYKDAIIYQLHVKSFYDANGDGIGDFRGLIEKLDYIASIGVTAVWLLPFYPSPRRDDGYDIAEYRGVHPDYGSMADARRFIGEAHKRGLRVITELVINHTSDKHPWFQRARKAKPGSAARDYYVWSDTDRKYAGTRIIFLDTEKSNWTWDEEAQAFYWHRFYSHQPDLNFDNPQVLKAVLSVMRYWLDLGVDGLRLDAVPYLIEREGTNNENLPETHDILKRIRQELDKRYPDRMLLAEANQWPEDTQTYFGDGDECHMAFHFPLMPRMYMAIAQEDRFPITDIMRQTPTIPSDCQWAIFLRNHDELTLEMVTDKERDYLWKTYASDPRARLNLGIRRRLAPLLERDRRRIELMKFLLLTMPGTPVVYYGDEIGMGDNIYLGDRDGVRTPMQWSSDRNGGFSKADPATLVLPPIMDPLYGFEAVNVEAQWRDPHSLLNWFRRMLLERRKHKAFGQGTIRFLHPQNRKVLAYLREHDDDNILCVANMSRTAQAVELDLSEFEGSTPVELSGDTAFPLVGQLTYLLTLPPHGFYWFCLSKNAQPPVWSSATSGPVVEHHTFVLRHSLADIATGDHSRSVLKRDVLPAYIRERRWFQQKDAKDFSVDIAIIGQLGDRSDILYVEITVEADGRKEHYALPLAIAWEDAQSSPFEAPLALARVRKGPRVGLMTDAFAVPAFAHDVLNGLREHRQIRIGKCGLDFRPTPAISGLAIAPNALADWPGAEQTNSTVILDRSAVIKLLRRLTPGVHPEAEMARELTSRGFTGTPTFYGEVVRTSSDGEEATLVVAQAYVQNQGDGWHWTLDRMGPLLEENAVPSDKDEYDFANYSAFASRAGERVGEMHRILAAESSNAAFSPERFTDKDAKAIGDRLMAMIDLALKKADTSGNNAASEIAKAIAKKRSGIARAAAAILAGAKGAYRTRIHGDLHLGQLLLAGDDVMVIDFEGEPFKTVNQRREKDLPLRDVAGMLRSFSYAAAHLQRSTKQTTADGKARAENFARRFNERASSLFLEGYQRGSEKKLTRGDLAILSVYMLEKAAYEVTYEAASRPDWLMVPLKGLSAIADTLLASAEHADA